MITQREFHMKQREEGGARLELKSQVLMNVEKNLDAKKGSNFQELVEHDLMESTIMVAKDKGSASNIAKISTERGEVRNTR